MKTQIFIDPAKTTKSIKSDISFKEYSNSTIKSVYKHLNIPTKKWWQFWKRGIMLSLFLAFSLIIQGQEVKYFAYNVISSSLVSGIGSGFHKKSNETFGHAFLNGIWKGMIAGTIDYTAKYSIKRNDYLITSRLIHSIGNSINTNAFNNQSIISNYYLTLYCFNFQTDLRHIHIKIDPATLAYTIFLNCNYGYNFNAKQSLLTGSFVFNSNHKPIREGLTVGQAIGNTIVAFKNTDKFFKPLQYSEIDYKKNLRHEFCHTLQYNEFNKFTPDFHSKLLSYFNINANFLATYSVNFLTNGYSNNYFEQEANHFQN